jgi:hypothetical protein
MTMCPLPIDWLDLLDGRPSTVSRAHLDDCTACRTVVASLEATRSTDPLRMPMPDNRQPRPALASSDDSDITFGDLRWLEPPDSEIRLPVLVLGIVEEADGAVDIAPLSLDRDAATSVDLLLDTTDTTTVVPWRVAFRRQSLVSSAFVKAQLGELTDDGRRVVNEALDGAAPAERTGPELESDHDPRLLADDWMRPLLTAAVGALDMGEDEDDPLASSPAAASPQLGKVLQFVLRWESVNEPRQRLAAATSQWSARTLWATLDASWGLHVAARLLTDYATDRLLLEPVSVHGLDRLVTLIVRTSVGDHPLMLQVRLHEGEPVVVAAEDAGISEYDVEALELLLP